MSDEVNPLSDADAGCPHAETTTLLWLYGEAPDDHAAHVATCAPCQDVAATHEAVLARTDGLWTALGSASAKPARSTPLRRALRWGGPALALAAAALLALRIAAPPTHMAPSAPSASASAPSASSNAPSVAEVDASTDALTFFDADVGADLDAELDALQAALDDAELDWFDLSPLEVP